MGEALRQTARGIFAAALQAVDVQAAVRRSVRVEDGTLWLAGEPVPLHAIDRVLVIALGKAAVPMYRAAAAALGGIAVEAVVVAPVETHPRHAGPEFLRGSHPTPDVHAEEAARRILELLATTEERTAVLFLISGGASSMVELALDPSITRADVADFHRALVHSGFGIVEMNTLRKHMSAVKGGRLARAAARARQQGTLLVSDVPLAAPDAIASGPSLADSSTVAQCRTLFARLRETAPLPQSVERFFTAEDLPETPKAGEDAFARSRFEVVLSSDHLARAALKAAVDAGFDATIDNTCDEWEYRDAGRYLLERSAARALKGGRACLISVGEVGVAIGAGAGEGGRNQQMALWCAGELAGRGRRGLVLCAGSDGIDGSSAAAGAVCDETTVERAAALGFGVEEALEGFDASPLLRAVGDLVVTGPTGNNLRDLRVFLTD